MDSQQSPRKAGTLIALPARLLAGGLRPTGAQRRADGRKRAAPTMVGLGLMGLLALSGLSLLPAEVAADLPALSPGDAVLVPTLSHTVEVTFTPDWQPVLVAPLMAPGPFDLVLTGYPEADVVQRVELRAGNFSTTATPSEPGVVVFESVPLPVDSDGVWFLNFPHVGVTVDLPPEFPLPSPRAPSLDGNPPPCSSGTTGGPAGQRVAANQQTSIGTSARELVTGAIEGDWRYQSCGNGATRKDAYSFGYSLYGANRYFTGGTFDIGFGGSWEGSRHLQTYYVNECRCWVTVGDRFYPHDTQDFYQDPKGVIGVHQDAYQKGRPATSCNTAIPALAKSALGLTKLGGFIAATIPNQWCSENWERITVDANGATGMGVEMHTYAAPSYAGGGGYISTRYSSTGPFTMDLDGNTLVDYWTNACTSCGADQGALRILFMLKANAEVVPPGGG